MLVLVLRVREVLRQPVVHIPILLHSDLAQAYLIDIAATIVIFLEEKIIFNLVIKQISICLKDWLLSIHPLLVLIWLGLRSKVVLLVIGSVLLCLLGTTTIQVCHVNFGVWSALSPTVFSFGPHSLDESFLARFATPPRLRLFKVSFRAEITLALDAIASVADAAYQGEKAGQRRHDCEEDYREDVAILAELLVLDLFELVGGALKPGPHARDTLVVLHAVGF